MILVLYFVCNLRHRPHTPTSREQVCSLFYARTAINHRSIIVVYCVYVYEEHGLSLPYPTLPYPTLHSRINHPSHPLPLAVVAKNRREERGVHKWHCSTPIGQTQQGNLENVEMCFTHVFCTCSLVTVMCIWPAQTSPLLCTPVQCLACHYALISLVRLCPGQTHPRLRRLSAATSASLLAWLVYSYPFHSKEAVVIKLLY